MQATRLESLRHLQRTGLLIQAEKESRQWLASCQTDADALPVTALLGAILCQQGQQTEGRRLLDRALLQKEHLDALALADLGGGYLLLNELAQAQSLLQTALDHAPQSGVILGRLGMVYYKSNQLSHALSHLEKAVALLPRVAALRFNLGRVLAGLGRLEEALQHMAMGEATTPLPMDLISLRLEILLRLGRGKEAEQLARAQLQQDNGAPRSVIDLVVTLAANNRHEEAAEAVRAGLERHAEDLELLACAANLAGTRGLFVERLRYLKKLTDLSPDNVHGWIEMAQVAAQRFDDNLAMQAAQKAMALTADKTGQERAAALSAMGVVETNRDHYSEAESLFAQALQQNTDFPAAHLGLGRLLMQVGRIEEAVAHYETVSRLSPTAAFSGLVHARRFPQEEGTLATMEQAARRPSLEGPVKSHILFDLAAAWENFGNYGKAFALALEANAASRQFLPYRAADHQHRVARITQRFSPAFLGQTATGSPTTLPVFVLGMPRSGTTLVEQIIASHPLAHGAGELSLIPEVIGSLNAWEKHVGSGREYPECLDTLNQPTLEKMAGRVLADLRKHAPQAQRIVDKLPHNFENLGLIHLLFPKAAIIHCVRDVRDIGISNFFTDYQAKYGGMGFAYDLADLGHHLADYQHLMEHWHRVLPGRILDVYYEELVEQPEANAKKILAHLNLPWDAKVLDFPALQRPIKTASVWQVRQPIYRSSTARWKHYGDHLAPMIRALQEAKALPPPLAVSTPCRDLFLEGMDFLKQEKWQEAEGCFRNLLANNPNHAAGHHFLGAALYQQGQYRWAAERMRRSVRLHSNHASWWRNLAMVLHAANEKEEAAQAMHTAISLEKMTRQSITPALSAVAQNELPTPPR